MTFLILQRYKLNYLKKKYICSENIYMYQHTLQCPDLFFGNSEKAVMTLLAKVRDTTNRSHAVGAKTRRL